MGHNINSIEIFSGAGGLAKGIELAGAHHNAFVEWNSDACKTLRLNYPPNIVHEEDIRAFRFDIYKDIDLIAGGPPCQPFSLGGKAKGHTDERDMFPSAISAIRDLRPKAFIFENVKGLLRKSFSDYFNYIILQLTYPTIECDNRSTWREHLDVLKGIIPGQVEDGESYNVVYKLVNAADYGVPQKRERVLIVGIRKDLHSDWTFPSPTHSSDALLWDKYVTQNYWKRHGIEVPEKDASILGKERERLLAKYGVFHPQLQPWVTIRDCIEDLPTPSSEGCPDSTREHIIRTGAREYPGHTGSNIDLPSKTIKAGGHGVPGGENMIKFTDGTVRYMTILEAKRIQTFPDDYPINGSWTEAMRQLGNAVPVRLSYIVASSLFQSVF